VQNITAVRYMLDLCEPT